MPTTEQLNNSLTGRYTVERLIGEGGMATVYLARDVRHNRRVALKVLKPDLGAIVGVERFLSEIQVTANLQHPNLLPLFDSGTADNLLFYVMPYVEGESLRARLEREKQLPIDEAVRIATAVASALDYAHRHGVIHRDLKPENVLLHEGQPLVADFGIALAVSNAGGNRITQTGLSLGTPQYMSPEQATGDRVIDGRTDIYSLGAVTYEMLTGEAPHVGNTSQAVIARVLTETPRRIRLARPSVPEQVEIAVERALEKLPADRWATAREFSEAITGARVVTRTTVAEHSAAGIGFGRRRVSVREALAWTIAAAAVVAGVILARKPQPPVVANPVDFEIQVGDSVKALTQGSAAGVAISHDGSTIVFQGRRGMEAPSLFVRRLDELEVHQVRGGDDARAPSFSPDGSEILYSSASGQPPVRRINVRGGTPRVLIDSAAPNGQISWRSEGPIVYASFARNGGLFLMSPETGVRQPLIASDSAHGVVRVGFPEVLPGGKAAVVTLWKGALDLASASLGVVSIPDGKLTELKVLGMNPRFTPAGGGHVVYATAEGWLYALPFSARSLRATGSPFPVVDGVRVGTGGAAGFSVADNGTLVFLAGNVARAQRELLVVNRAGAEQTLGLKLAIYNHPRVSPNSRDIILDQATESAGLYPNPDVWRFDLQSKVLARVTTDSNSAYPSWLDGGTRIGFGRLRVGGDSEVMVRGLYAGAKPEPYVKGKFLRGVTAGRSGKYVALRVGPQGNQDIWLAHVDSLAAPRPFLTEAYNEVAPAISPDGKLLAYVTNRTGRFEVYVRPILGRGAEVQISTDGGTEPAWGADSRELFYRGTTHIVSAKLTPMPGLAVVGTSLLFRDDYVKGTISPGYDVFPDGKRFVMVRDRSVGTTGVPIIVKMNWLARGQRAGRP